jgi:hypothetical protein
MSIYSDIPEYGDLERSRHGEQDLCDAAAKRDGEMQLAMCEVAGFTVTDVERHDTGNIKRIWVKYPTTWTGASSQPWPPDFLNDLNAVFAAAKHLGLHDRDKLDLRVKWVANLRTVVSRRCPVNKVGSPIVSDLDLLASSSRELCEAALRTMKKWNPEWT